MRAKRYQFGSIVERARKRGPAAILFRWVEGGRFRSVRPGDAVSLPTTSDHERAVAMLRVLINDPSSLAAGQTTESELIDMFLEKHAKVECHKLTASSYRSLADVHIRPAWGNHLVRQVKTLDVEAWLQKYPHSNQVKAHIRRLLHTMFQFALKLELVERNPISLIRQSRHRLKTPRVLTMDEFKVLIGQLYEPTKTLVWVLAGLGLRVSEALGHQWQDINWERLEITIQRSWSEGEVNETKTPGSAAVLPLTAALAKVLRAHLGRSAYQGAQDFVFAGLGGKPPWPDGLLADHLRPAAVRAGITWPIGFHSFRRTYATLLHSQGTPLAVQKELMRHSDIRTTMNIYTQAVSDDRREAADKLAELLSVS